MKKALILNLLLVIALIALGCTLEDPGATVIVGNPEVKVVDDDGDIITIDEATRTLTTIDLDHQKIHVGDSFSAWYMQEVSDTGDKTIITFLTPNTPRWCHAAIMFSATQPAHGRLLEAPTITNNTGGSLGVYNRDRNATRAATVIDTSQNPNLSGNATFFTETTMGNVTGGTEITHDHLGVGIKKNALGGTSRGVQEWILKQNTLYAFVIESATDDDNVHLIEVDFYEHTNYAEDAGAAAAGVVGCDCVPTDLSGYATISTENRAIYVDKENTGTENGEAWATAYDTIQEAVDSLEAVVINAHTIYVRDGTKLTGTADENTANHLVDDANSQFTAGDVGKRVFNIDDGIWGVVTAFVDAGDLTLAADTFPAGTEDYSIEATPYRETIYLNGAPTIYPAHNILGSVTIRAEFYFNAICDANAVVGAIVDATYDFSDIEVGDRVWVLDLNGANERANDYEYGTVDDITNAATGTLGTTLTKTPTINWYYGIVKTEISASDDGTDAGTARDQIVRGTGISNVTFEGFLFTFSDATFCYVVNCRNWLLQYSAAEKCDRGVQISVASQLDISLCYLEAEFTIWIELGSICSANRNVLYATATTERAFYVVRNSYGKLNRSYLDSTGGGADGEALYILVGGVVEGTRNFISNTFLFGAWCSGNSYVRASFTTNNGITPEQPAGTVEGTYINITP